VGPKSKSRQKVGRDIKKVEKHWTRATRGRRTKGKILLVTHGYFYGDYCTQYNVLLLIPMPARSAYMQCNLWLYRSHMLCFQYCTCCYIRLWMLLWCMCMLDSK